MFEKLKELFGKSDDAPQENEPLVSDSAGERDFPDNVAPVRKIEYPEKGGN